MPQITSSEKFSAVLFALIMPKLLDVSLLLRIMATSYDNEGMTALFIVQHCLLHKLHQG